MKTSDIGLVFDNKLSPKPWAKINISSVAPDNLWFGTIPTELGNMTLIGAGDALCYLGFEETRSLEKCARFFPNAELSKDVNRAKQMAVSIMGIWNGTSHEVLNIVINGTPFQKSVWNTLMHIPTGHAISYGTIAESVGKPKAVRAVGTAVGANPISLIIPCHRVVQQSGKVENYGWGDEMKQKILKLEYDLIKGSAMVA